MLKYVKGDILLSKADAITHGVAPNDNFAQGLALSLREQWPAMYKDFRHYCHQEHPSEGGLWTWQGVNQTKIINLFTQEAAYDQGAKPGKAKTEYVNHALRSLCEEAQRMELKSLAITRVATGVGGLDWENVKPLIEKHLGSLDIPVYVYEEFHQGEQAQEN